MSTSGTPHTDPDPQQPRRSGAHTNGSHDAAPVSERHLSSATGRTLWRSLDELAGSEEFTDFLHREFPTYASELLDGSRRHFLKIMGASVALAGVGTLGGCRRPDHRILAYNQAPEHSVPGKPIFYATAMPLPGGGCEGLLAETFEGRPTKLEGNPLHPVNQGRTGLMSQASVLDLYDPDRVGEFADWDEFHTGAKGQFAAFGGTQGEGLAFLVDKATSPSRDRLRDRILERWPKAKWFAWEPIDSDGALDGSHLAFGSPYRQQWDLSRAHVVVAFECDFLSAGPGMIQDMRSFAAGRYTPGGQSGRIAADSEMSRLYVVESMMTLTGGQADHRIAVKPSRVGAVLAQVAESVLRRMGRDGQPQLQQAVAQLVEQVAGDDLPSEDHIDAIAEDLVANAGRGAVMVGRGQSAAVHALAHALNGVLGNTGSTVRYHRVRGDAAQSSLGSMRTLVAHMKTGSINTLVSIGCNPVYDAPADLDFPGAYANVKNRIHLGAPDETAAVATTVLAHAHFLEAWSDVETWAGTYSVVQPQIAPLISAHSDLELLAAILGDTKIDGYEIVRETLRQRTTRDAVAFDTTWRRTLHDGVLADSGQPGESPGVNWPRVAQLLRAAATQFAPTESIDVLFAPCPKVYDGRAANNGWLQEVPNPVTKVSWDNPALISKATADRLGLSTNRHSVTPQYNHAQVVTIQLDGRSLEIPVWVQPGLPDDVVVLHLGYGRKVAGRIGTGTGFDTYALRTSAAMHHASGATVEPVRSRSPYLIACTQDHWTMEGRNASILNEVDLAAWRKYGDVDYSGDKSVQIDPYGNDRGLKFADRLTTRSHTPADKDVYLPKQRKMLGKQFVEVDENGEPKRDARGRIIGKLNEYGKRIQQWGMSIDLSTCTGCSACTIACQAENNIPIVGKTEVANGREMHWIRVDRYYASAPNSEDYGSTGPTGPDIDMLIQPIPCMQCENAPCEVVCPVNATTHSWEGTNDMAYNRCIGTRYCSNNCPYKVRRFNYFDYGTKQFHGTNALSGTILEPDNEDWVPPRLREKKLEIATMQYNPHVTVRSRGVMEKCTYCVQRVNAARVETKLADLDIIPDGFIQTACQQACPSGSITFGDIYDHGANEGQGSLVSQLRNGPRSYGVLDYLNTRPRTTFMVRLRNPNPRIRRPNDDPFGHHGADHLPEGAPHDEAGHEPDHDAQARSISLPVLMSSGASA